MMTEPKLLSECGHRLIVDDTEGDRYEIDIEPGDFLVVRAGATMDKATARFTHPNIVVTARTIHNFKHYRKNGSKFWTSRAGVDHCFVIPRTAIKLLPQKGYSWIPAEINGVKVAFNVSGGGDGKVWTDYLRAYTCISVNHRLKDMTKLAEVAVRNSPMEPIQVKPMDADQEAYWQRLAARVSKGLIEKVAKLVEDGKKPIVKLLPGYSIEQQTEGVLVSVGRRAKKIMLPHGDECLKKWKVEYTGAVKELMIELSVCKGRVKVGQVDWAETAAANGITM